MKLENTLTIDTDVDRCWHVLSEEFGDIHHWAAGIAKSHLKNPQAGLLGNERTCEIPGFGTLKEVVNQFDPNNHQLRYDVTGMPSFIATASNVWFVKPAGPSKATVGSIFILETKGLLGKIMSPMLRRQLLKGSTRLLEEFRVYAETGNVHTRTQKARRKQAA